MTAETEETGHARAVATSATEEHDRQTLDDVGDTGEFIGIRLANRRRRPSGEKAPLRWRLVRADKIWLALLGVVVVSWIVLYASDAADPLVERLDQAVTQAFVNTRTPWLTEPARFIALLASAWTILFLRWFTIFLLAVVRRWRHLVAFVFCVFVVRVLVNIMQDVFGRPRPTGVVILGDWQGYAHPSRPAAALTVVLVGMAFALFPRGRTRRWWVIAASGAVVLLSLAQLYLAVERVSDIAFAIVLGVAVAVLTFRIYAPEGTFPVTYGRRRTAHLTLDDRRVRAIREAFDEQLGLELVRVEEHGLESSGGSTPVLVHVRSDGTMAKLFGKLYAESHLRSDRYYKLGRTIMYGSLEDEVAFNSVRQLVEYEDYMLRVMRDAGIPVPKPYGFIELMPEREYLIMSQFLERSEEAGDARIDDDAIHQALAIVRRMWDSGIAHRDIKPGNVLVRDGRVWLIDVAFGQVRPSAWRQAVDLANMMLVLALRGDAKTIYDRACEMFAAEEIAEAFAATRSVTMPRELRTAIKEDGRDLVGEFRALAPRRRPIAIQRWTVRRIWLTARTLALALVTVAVLVLNLADRTVV